MMETDTSLSKWAEPMSLVYKEQWLSDGCDHCYPDCIWTSTTQVEVLYFKICLGILM